MPKITQYEAGNLALRPTETGIEARAAAARRIGATYNQVGGAEQQLGQETAQLGAFKGHVQETFGGRLAQGVSDAGSAAVRYMDHQQISHGALGLAGLFANATQDWNDTLKNTPDSNDPTIARDFLEKRLEPALNKFREGFTTERAQQWAESHIDNLRQHFFTKTSADMSTRAGLAAQMNARQTENLWSSTLRADPSALDVGISTLEGSINGVVNSSPNLSGTVADKVRSELLQKGKESLVKSAVMGLIDKNPDVDLTAIEKKYGAYINSAEISTLQKYAEARKKSNIAFDQANERHLKQQDHDVAQASFSKNWTDNVSFDENGKANIKPQFFKDVETTERLHPGAVPGRAQTLVNWGLSKIKEKKEAVVDDPVVAGDLHDRLPSEDNPTTQAQILEADYKHQLTPHTRNVLLAQLKANEETPLKGPIFQAAMGAAKHVLGVTVMPDGQDRYQHFLETFRPQYQARLRAGKAEPNDLDTRDPDSLISKALKPFKPTDAELLNARLLGKKFEGLNLGGSQPQIQMSPTPAFVPPRNAGWTWFPTTRQYKDPEGTFYDAAGKKVKEAK
jgi:hypothetical protein